MGDTGAGRLITGCSGGSSSSSSGESTVPLADRGEPALSQEAVRSVE